MKSLLIIGAGGYGKSVGELAEQCGYDRIDYLDDNNPSAVGRIDEIDENQERYDDCIVAIGNPDIREGLHNRIQNNCSLIHPRAVIYKSASVGKGCVIEANAVVNSNAIIGDASFVCAGAVVNHDAVVGAFSQIDCNAVVASGVKVPQKTKVKSCAVWDQK